MKITQDPAEFRPVTIRVETKDEWDQLYYICSAVANDKIVRSPQVIKAAQAIVPLLRFDEEGG